MSTNESYLFFLRFVKEKHNQLVTSLDQLVQVLISENSDAKLKNAESAKQFAQDLLSAISSQDRPAWLINLLQALNTYIQSTSVTTKLNLTKCIIDNLSKIKGHEWSFENSNEKAFDFDAIFEHYKSESRIPELFDEIISILEKIEASGEIDSVNLINSLSKVLATLKQNKNGSYFSLNSAWEFLVSFIKNYMWEELSKIPALGSAMVALEKTIKETNEEMFSLHTKIESSMTQTIENEIKGLKDKTDFPFIAYDKTGLELSENTNPPTIDRRV